MLNQIKPKIYLLCFRINLRQLPANAGVYDDLHLHGYSYHVIKLLKVIYYKEPLYTFEDPLWKSTQK